VRLRPELPLGPPASANWLPIAGDWDGDEVDTVGLYNPASGTFYLRNSNSAGPADVTFRYGPTSSTWKPIAGDWDQDGTDTVGLYNPTTGTFYLRNDNAPGPADVTFRYGPPPAPGCRSQGTGTGCRATCGCRAAMEPPERCPAGLGTPVLVRRRWNHSDRRPSSIGCRPEGSASPARSDMDPTDA
jgi:hypothetical protein